MIPASKLASGQFQGLCLDPVESESTTEIQE